MRILRNSAVVFLIVACKPTMPGEKTDNKSIDAITQADQSARNELYCGDPDAPNKTSKDALKRVYATLPVGIKSILNTSGALKNSHGTSGDEYAGIENITLKSSVTHLVGLLVREVNAQAVKT